jgi:hypothetical protein
MIGVGVFKIGVGLLLRGVREGVISCRLLRMVQQLWNNIGVDYWEYELIMVRSAVSEITEIQYTIEFSICHS